MSDRPSRLWILGPPFAILVSLLAYYYAFPSFRQWVDTRFPWVEANIGSRLPQRIQEADESSTPPQTAVPPATDLPEEPTPEPPKPAATPAAPSYLTADGSVDIQKLAAERSAWPPTVTLKAVKEFPAVVAGKVVGKINVPAGTEAKLVTVRDGKLGVEYQGGGAWLTVEETDLAQRIRR